MSPVRWTADRMDQLENAARRGQRVVLSRRGTEYVVVALRVTSEERHDVLVGLLLPRAVNVRAAIREEEMSQTRGVLTAPSAQEPAP